MTISRDEIRRIAELAGLGPEPSVSSIADSLQSILDHVAMLDELDVSDVAPTSFGSTPDSRHRDDRPQPGLTAEEATRNAPDAVDGQFRVPGILEG